MKLPFRKKQEKLEGQAKTREKARRSKPARTKPRVAGHIIACLVFFAVLCVVPVYVNSAIGYVPVLAYCAVIAIAFAYPRIVARRLEFGLLLDRHVLVRDTQAKLLLRFSNPSLLLCPRIDAELRVTDIFGEDDTTSHFSFSLGSRGSRDFELGVRFAHIGIVKAGVKTVVVYDPFGLFFRTIHVSDVQEIEVMPRIYPVDASLTRSLLLQETMDSRTPFNRDGMDFSDVREYVYGDPLKSIHWKLSSHTNTLYTRLFETVGNPEIDVLCGIDFGKHDNQTLMSLYDSEVEAALSVFGFGITNGLRMRMTFADGQGGAELFDSLNHPDQRSIVHAFPLPLAERERDGLPDILLQRSAGVRGGNYIVCTAALSDALVDAITAIDKGHCRVVLMFFMPSALDSTERRELLRPLRRLEQDNVTCFAFDSAAQIEGVTHE